MCARFILLRLLTYFVALLLIISLTHNTSLDMSSLVEHLTVTSGGSSDSTMSKQKFCRQYIDDFLKLHFECDLDSMDPDMRCVVQSFVVTRRFTKL
jgi:ABC-type multidrug transport system permease subunit